MSSIANPHDRYFRGAMRFRKVAEEFFQCYLPASLKAQIDFSTLKLCSENFINEELSTLASDILYQVNFIDHSNYLYIMVEHQSKPDSFMAFRILQYIVAIWARHRNEYPNYLLPLVLPVVFYHGKQDYKFTCDIKNLIDAPSAIVTEYLFSPYQLINVHTLTEDHFQPYTYAGILSLLMKYVHTSDFITTLDKIKSYFNVLEIQ